MRPHQKHHIPARLDRLPGGAGSTGSSSSRSVPPGFLDGLDAVHARRSRSGEFWTKGAETLGLTEAQVGASATAYLAGAVIGALVFGYATDRLGRKKLFFITVGLYLTATALSAFSWNLWKLPLLSGADRRRAGIGGE